MSRNDFLNESIDRVLVRLTQRRTPRWKADRQVQRLLLRWWTHWQRRCRRGHCGTSGGGRCCRSREGRGSRPRERQVVVEGLVRSFVPTNRRARRGVRTTDAEEHTRRAKRRHLDRCGPRSRSFNRVERLIALIIVAHGGATRRTGTTHGPRGTRTSRYRDLMF